MSFFGEISLVSLQHCKGKIVFGFVENFPENSRIFLSPFSQNSIVHCGGGGICVGVSYIRCLNMAVPHVARELCMSIFVHDSYLCILMQRVGCIA